MRGIDDRHERCQQQEHEKCEHGEDQRCKQGACMDKEATIHYKGDGTTFNYWHTAFEVVESSEQ